MDIQGKIIVILPAQSGISQRTGNGWMSQQYVLEVPGQYPKKFLFKVFGQDRIQQFNLQMGEYVTIQYDTDAHESNGRWFGENTAYNIIRGQVQQGYQQQQMQSFAPPQQQYQQAAPAPFPPQQAAPAPAPQAPAPAAQPQGQQLPFPPAQ